MKHLSNLALGLFFSDQRKQEKTPGDLLSQGPEAAPRHMYPRQDFAQLLAHYKRAGYEAVKHWEQTQRVNK